MNVLEKGAPAAAVIAALSTLACCVPLGFLGAAGLASVSVWVQPLRPWLLAGSVALLCLGFVQLYFRKSACNRRSRLSLVLFWIAVAVVVLVILFPQVIASVVAG
jgi:membrane-associated HD superfamily phosphohydrolase